RAARRRDLARNPGTTDPGRIPDAELRFPSGSRIAIELDLTPKRSQDYQDILNNYLAQKYDAVWWYVAPGVVARLQKIVAANQAADVVTVEPWRGDVEPAE